jgi:hypothetical protein
LVFARRGYTIEGAERRSVMRVAILVLLALTIVGIVLNMHDIRRYLQLRKL